MKAIVIKAQVLCNLAVLDIGNSNEDMILALSRQGHSR